MRFSLLFLLFAAGCSKPDPSNFDGSMGQTAEPILIASWIQVDPSAGQDLEKNRIDFDALGGKIILVERWATWCSPCIAKIPALIDLQKKHAKELAIVSLTNESETIVRGFLEKTTLDELESGRPKERLSAALNYSVALVNEKEPTFDSYFGRLRGVPSFYIIGKDGRIERAVVGSYEIVLKEVKRLLENRKRTPPEEEKAQRLLSVQREIGTMVNKIFSLQENDKTDMRVIAAAMRRRITLLKELSELKPSSERENRWKILGQLVDLWSKSSDREKAVVLSELEIARTEMFEVLKATQAYPMSWINLAYNMTLVDDPELIDAARALKAVQNSLDRIRKINDSVVLDMAYDAKARALFNSGDIPNAIKAQKKSIAHAIPVRKKRFEAALGLYEDFKTNPDADVEEILEKRKASGFQSASVVKLALGNLRIKE